MAVEPMKSRLAPVPAADIANNLLLMGEWRVLLTAHCALSVRPRLDR